MLYTLDEKEIAYYKKENPQNIIPAFLGI